MCVGGGGGVNLLNSYPGGFSQEKVKTAFSDQCAVRMWKK